MKTTNPLLITRICLGVVAAAMAVAIPAMLERSHSQRRETQALRADLRRASDDIQRLEEEKAGVSAELARDRDQLQQLETELACAQEDKSTAKEEAAPPTPPRPVKIRAYLGNQCVGMGWLVSSGVSKDPNTGAVTYEPVVILDEAIKQNFVTYRTNFVEREVSRSTTVNYNYPWVYYYPVVFTARTNKASFDPVPTPKTPAPTLFQPQNSKPFLSTTIQRPTDKPFLPAVSRLPSSPSPNRQSWSGALPPQTGVGIDPGKRPFAGWAPPGS